MANTSPPPRTTSGPWIGALGSLAVAAILMARAVGSYGGAWFAGVLGVICVLLYGSARERMLLIVLATISVWLGGEPMYLGIRQVLFIAIFMFLGNYAPVRPVTALVLYFIGLIISFVISGEISPLFTVGPSVILLLIASAIVETRKTSGKRKQTRGWTMGLLSLASFVLPFLGPGSRSALIVWTSFSLRRVTVSMVLAVLVLAVLVSTIPQLEVFDRITNSYNELTDPLPQSGINLRAVELLIFESWASNASWPDLLFGSHEIIYMPGDFLGFLYDPPFVPHNQVIGLVFQFGLVGEFLILMYLYGYWRSLSDFRLGRFVLLIYLLLAFIVVHGFVNQDISIVAGVLLSLRRSLPTGRFALRRRAQGNVPAPLPA